MGQARGVGARRPQGGMARLFGPDGSARDAVSRIPRAPETGDHGEEVGRSPAMGWRPELQEEIQSAEGPEAGRHGGWELQEACLKVLLAEDKSLPLRAIPQLDEESADRPVLVVPIPDADPGPPLQGVLRVEGPAEDPVGRGAEGEGREEPVQDPGPPRRREAQPGGTRLPFHYGCGKEGWSRRRKTRGARCQNGSSRSSGSGKRREGRRPRSWAPERNYRFFSPRPPSRHPPTMRSRGRARFSFVLSFPLGHDFICHSFVISLVRRRSPSSWDRPGPGRRAKGSCNVPPRADSRRETRFKKCAAIV